MPPNFGFSEFSAGELVIYNCCCHTFSVLPGQLVLSHPAFDPTSDRPRLGGHVKVDTASGPNFARRQPRLVNVGHLTASASSP